MVKKSLRMKYFFEYFSDFFKNLSILRVRYSSVGNNMAFILLF